MLLPSKRLHLPLSRRVRPRRPPRHPEDQLSVGQPASGHARGGSGAVGCPAGPQSTVMDPRPLHRRRIQAVRQDPKERPMPGIQAPDDLLPV